MCRWCREPVRFETSLGDGEPGTLEMDELDWSEARVGCS